MTGSEISQKIRVGPRNKTSTELFHIVPWIKFASVPTGLTHVGTPVPNSVAQQYEEVYNYVCETKGASFLLNRFKIVFDMERHIHYRLYTHVRFENEIDLIFFKLKFL